MNKPMGGPHGPGRGPGAMGTKPEIQKGVFARLMKMLFKKKKQKH